MEKQYSNSSIDLYLNFYKSFREKFLKMKHFDLWEKSNVIYGSMICLEVKNLVKDYNLNDLMKIKKINNYILSILNENIFCDYFKNEICKQECLLKENKNYFSSPSFIKKYRIKSYFDLSFNFHGNFEKELNELGNIVRKISTKIDNKYAYSHLQKNKLNNKHLINDDYEKFLDFLIKSESENNDLEN